LHRNTNSAFIKELACWRESPLGRGKSFRLRRGLVQIMRDIDSAIGALCDAVLRPEAWPIAMHRSDPAKRFDLDEQSVAAALFRRRRRDEREVGAVFDDVELFVVRRPNAGVLPRAAALRPGLGGTNAIGSILGGRVAKPCKASGVE
jgi:hypothetical protein